MIYSKEFLRRLDLDHNKTIYARITALNLQENPIEQVEGRITQGSINVDGASAMRRSCSLTMVTDQINISDYIWTFNTKFKLEVGVENNIDSSYPKIIWFKQGVYLITSFNSALSATGFTINLQGKDKMCQLNGEAGGTFLSSIDFGKYDEVTPTGEIVTIRMVIKDIIREMVHTYGKEPFHNILIEDLGETVLQLQNYTGTQPIYLVRRADGTNPKGEYDEAYFGDKECYVNGYKTMLAALPEYDNLMDYGHASTEFTFEPYGETSYYAAKFEKGAAIGYIEIPYHYPSDLIANVGETVVSVLDKIKNMLGDFEYFYNLEGQFVFRKKPASINTSWGPDMKIDGEYAVVEGLATASDVAYNFIGNELLINFNNNPTINNVKNDYSVWGKRDGNVPIHMRYAIDKKPLIYTTINVNDSELIGYNKTYGLNVLGQQSKTYIATNADYRQYSLKQHTHSVEFQFDYEQKNNIPYINSGQVYDKINNRITITVPYMQTAEPVMCDWRELIYRMAADFYKYNHMIDFSQRVAEANQETFPTGITGYEQYYEDIFGFWRDIYNIEPQYVKDFLWRPLEGESEKGQLYQQKIIYTPYTDAVPAGTPVYYIVRPKNREFKPYYKRAYMRFPGVYGRNSYDGPDDTIDYDDLFVQETIYEPMDESFRRSLCSLESVNPQGLFIVDAIGYRGDLTELSEEMYVIKPIANPEDTTLQLYTLDTEPPIAPTADAKRIAIKEVAEWQPYKLHYTIEMATELEAIEDNEIIYTKRPYKYYKPHSFEDGNTDLDSTMYAFVPAEEIYLDQTYYHLLDASIIEVIPLEPGEKQSITYNLQPYFQEMNQLLASASKIFDNNEQLGYFTLNNEHLTQLMNSIKRLVYIRGYCTKMVDQLNEEWTEDNVVTDDIAQYSNILTIVSNKLSEFYNKATEIVQLLTSFNEQTYGYSTGYDFAGFVQVFQDQKQQINNAIQALNKYILLQKVSFNSYLFSPILYDTKIDKLVTDSAAKTKLDIIKHIINSEQADINSLLAELGELAASEITAGTDLLNASALARNTLTIIKNSVNNYSFKLTPFYAEVQDIKLNGDYYTLEECTGYVRSPDFYLENEKHHNWNKIVYEEPWLLNFWFDFITPSGELAQFSVPAIGPRQKASNDNQVKVINYPITPLVVFHRDGEQGELTGYNYINIDTLDFDYKEIKKVANVIISTDGDNEEGAIGRSKTPLTDPQDGNIYMYWKCISNENNDLYWKGYEYDPLVDCLSVSAQSKTAKEAIDSLLYTHGCCAESVTITTVPIYYLEPNSKVYVYDADTGIEGNYLITKITVPLTYNGTMQLTGTRLIERI